MNINYKNSAQSIASNSSSVQSYSDVSEKGSDILPPSVLENINLNVFAELYECILRSDERPNTKEPGTVLYMVP